MNLQREPPDQVAPDPPNKGPASPSVPNPGRQASAQVSLTSAPYDAPNGTPPVGTYKAGTTPRMINTLSILISLFGCVFVVVRAVMLDKTLPWFAPRPETPAAPKHRFRPGTYKAQRQ